MKERPLVYSVTACTVIWLCAVVFQWDGNLHLLLFALALSLVFTAFTLDYFYLRTIGIVCICATCAMIYFIGYNHFRVDPVRDLYDRTLTVSATVMQTPDVYEDSQRARLQIDADPTITEHSFQTLCYLPLTEQPLQAGDRVRATVHFYMPQESEGFDRISYQAALGCFIASSYKENDDHSAVLFERIGSVRNTFRFLPLRVADYCRDTITRYLPQQPASLLQALLLGDKSNMSDADQLALRKSGLSHLVAVSGLHVGFLVGFCFIIFGRKWGSIFSIALILFFIPMAGATPSVIRAGIMYMIATGAFVFRKQADSLNSLFFALLLLLLLNPYAVMSLSLQLSFLATLGLILLSSRMQRRIMQPFEKCSVIVRKVVAIPVGAFCCTVCATLFTMPVLLSSFGYVSVLSIASNILILCVAAICFIGGFAICLLAPLPVPLAEIISKPVECCLNYMLWVAYRVSELPFGVINWGDYFGLAAIVLFFSAVLAWILLAKRLKWKRWFSAVGCALILLTICGMRYESERFTVTYLPCGSGQAIIVSDTQDHMTLIDCSGGGGYRDAAELVTEWMQWNGFTQIDTLILTAVDRGHARDLPALLSRVRVQQIIIPAGCKETKYNQDLLALVSSAEQVESMQTLSDGAAPLCLFPITDGKLGVSIGQQVLILHSPTQKQLSTYLSNSQLTGHDLVLSQSNMSDGELLRDAMQKMQVKRLIVQAAVGDLMPSFGDCPIISPYISGEIRHHYAKKEFNKWQLKNAQQAENQN